MTSRSGSVTVVLVAAVMVLLAIALGMGVGGPGGGGGQQDDRPPGASQGTPAKSTGVPPRVVVVGAGLSGLSAALELADGGARVVVVDMSL